jgi:sarcosine oxidase subunit beta
MPKKKPQRAVETPKARNAADVIVVGAGVVGCSLALHLARAGARVRVFDKGPLCAGMSARSGALVRMHYTFAPEAELAWKSLEYFENWERIVGGRCGFERTGFAIVVGPDNVDKLQANVRMLKSRGVDTDVLQPAALHEIEPLARLDDVAAVAYEPRSGYADPVATTQALAEAADKSGAQFNLNLPVAALNTTAGRCTGVTDASGKSHEADFVCLVTGPWTDPILAPFGIRIGIQNERAQIAFFRRPPTLRHLAFIDTVAGSYLRPHGAELTLAGLGELAPGDLPDPDQFREQNDPEFIDEARRRLAARIPAMADCVYAQGHAGIYDVSPDARPVIGQISELPGLFVAAGFSGTGFKISPAVGAAMAEMIIDGKSKTVDLSPFSFERIRTGNLIKPPNEYAMGAGFGHRL